MKRAFTNILSINVNEAANFYQDLLGLDRHFDSDWFIILTHVECPNFELGILERKNPLVPNEADKSPAGVMLTFVVEDVELIYKKAKNMDVRIIENPTNTPYGQRRMIIEDLDGTIVDISSLIPAL